MLSDFFRINLPYCIQRTKEGEWYALNREYKPLGFYTNMHITEEDLLKLPIGCEYNGITEKFLEDLAGNGNYTRDDNGRIDRVWLYDDASNPADSSFNSHHWIEYLEKLKKLSKKQVKKDFGFKV